MSRGGGFSDGAARHPFDSFVEGGGGGGGGGERPFLDARRERGLAPAAEAFRREMEESGGGGGGLPGESCSVCKSEHVFCVCLLRRGGGARKGVEPVPVNAPHLIQAHSTRPPDDDTLHHCTAVLAPTTHEMIGPNRLISSSRPTSGSSSWPRSWRRARGS